ncbi:MAG: ATP-dependent protease ATPase subunit HslU [Alphaproteobacteria bacterium GM202ARS2]|nr:ATP-dependent protease ATPase subunit HslU [Alphaproteobacteria bacterium GM202ARS2]
MSQEETFFSPREIISELNRFIVGQEEAKRAVAIALRNRWRRQRVKGDLHKEILPKNLLMMGPTGVGKTEIARRLALLARSPFIKVEATKYTEVGYVGRDVEQIIRDLLKVALNMERQNQRHRVRPQAELNVERRLVQALQKKDQQAGRSPEDVRQALRQGGLDNERIQLEVTESAPAGMPMMDVPGMPGAQMGMINLGDMLSKVMGGTKKRERTMTVKEARKVLLNEESDKLIDEDAIVRQAITSVEENGIVFIDEIDKICASSERRSGDVSREGVQRDLLPLIEGTLVNTPQGAVKTDHILFIASGAFHFSKPSDLMPELQGRLPVRVRLESLGRGDFVRILTEPENNLVRQYQALMATEDVTLEMTKDAIETIADISTKVNAGVEDIGARRLHTIMEKVLENISFAAGDGKEKRYEVDGDYVRAHLGELADDQDLSRFIL